MRKLVSLAAVAAVLSFSQAAAGTVDSTVIKIDGKARTLTLADKTVMIMGPSVDLSTVKEGMKVRITANEDDNGFAPATAVTPIQ